MAEVDDLFDDLSEAVDLIDTYGADMLMKRKTAKSFNPANSQVTVENDSDVTFKGLIEDMEQGVFNGNLVKGGDKKVTTAAKYFDKEPGIEDTVELPSGKYSVLNPVPTMVGAKPILYELHLRK